MSDELTALETERSELMAKNAAATSWGAAVGARHERIMAIDRTLAALAAAGEQKPHGWQWHFGGTWHTIDFRESIDPEKYARSMSGDVRPFYLAPQPDPGWDEAIEACKKIAEKWLGSDLGGEVYAARSIIDAILAIRLSSQSTSDAGGGVREALEHARKFIENGVELGYIKMPDADTPDPAHKTLSKIIAALSNPAARIAMPAQRRG